MVAELKPYPAYKKSGVEWLWDVPEHWEVNLLGQIGRSFKGSGGTKNDESKDGVPYIRYGDLYTQHEFFSPGQHDPPRRRHGAPDCAGERF